jgi:bacterial/archaeal transporter family-2 protein
MNRGEAISLTIASGLLVGLQPAANAALADHVGDFGAAFVSIVITLIVAAIVLVIAGHPGRLSGLGSASPVQLIGGVGGAAVVIVSLITVRTLGTGGVVALIVAAQLVIAIFIDRFGWFGIHQIGISPVRLVGLGLVIAGTALITKV